MSHHLTHIESRVIAGQPLSRAHCSCGDRSRRWHEGRRAAIEDLASHSEEFMVGSRASLPLPDAPPGVLAREPAAWSTIAGEVAVAALILALVFAFQALRAAS